MVSMAAAFSLLYLSPLTMHSHLHLNLHLHLHLHLYLYLTTTMSPPSKELKGIRPTPLKIQKTIHKPSSSSTSRQNPVIIYAHSPKIIHTHAHDFMALVQKLTGNHNNSSETASHPEAHTDDDTLNVSRDIKVSCSLFSPVSKIPLSFDDVPLFTPTIFTPSMNFYELFCSPMPLSASPSLLEAVRTIPDL
ncbi:VQ motif-containing protein 8, chloroplastic-like [Dioscorea cayenensis subsp. rotundata]|uniref:VQ motif-containing protein 8, chloroplastic-like n=1 Tax=Dioscorea cayennensis subsp. rotundata TaxID=55577 RepID=A0AB40BDE9_DIOCR|nr:VQ motif-containing protein 8, chloroplastic-like [Dioscorea cayenensis subsp. rotundata]